MTEDEIKALKQWNETQTLSKKEMIGAIVAMCEHYGASVPRTSDSHMITMSSALGLIFRMHDLIVNLGGIISRFENLKH